MTGFSTEIASAGIPKPMLDAVSGAYRQLFEASEGDARRYMKAVLERSGMAEPMEFHYGKDWSGKAFNLIRDFFVHKGCDVYYVPGIARLIFGSSDDIQDPNMDTWNDVLDIVKFITTAHKGEFSRNLEHITTVQEGPRRGMQVRSKPMTLRELYDMFSREIKETGYAEREAFEKSGRSPTGYRIIVLDDFKKAHEFLKYTPSNSPWCYLQGESTFDTYRHGGNKLYLALAPGFEKLKPGDKGYGRSMIGFDMGPVGVNGVSKMKVCNNRYNHGTDLEKENSRSGDAKYTELELAEILGIPVWKDCPGYTEEELIESGRVTRDILERMFPDEESLRKAAAVESSGREWKRGISVHRDEFGEMPTYEFLSAQDNMILCYAIVGKKRGKLTFFDMYRNVAPGRFVITRDHESKMVDADGDPLHEEWYYQIGKPDSTRAPFPVACKVGEWDPLEWNMMDLEGNLLLDDWHGNVSSTHGNYVIVYDMVDNYNASWKPDYYGFAGSKICALYDRRGNLAFRPVDDILHSVIGQTHVFQLEKDGLFNYLIDDVHGSKLLYRTWCKKKISPAVLYRIILRRYGMEA